MVVSVEDQAGYCKNNRSCAVQDGSVVCVVATTFCIPFLFYTKAVCNALPVVRSVEPEACMMRILPNCSLGCVLRFAF